MDRSARSPRSRALSWLAAPTAALATLAVLAMAFPREPAPGPSRASAQGPEASPAAALRAAPTPEEPVRLLPTPRVSPITAAMVERMRAIAARDPARVDEVFAKMGGSSVVSRAFLHCFEEDDVDLAGRESLGETLAYFRGGRVLSHTAFGRTSLAAQVGWSIRSAMAGRPPYVLQEARATRARWALAFFGSNDVEGKDAHKFGQRLDRLVATLADQGVVPLLAATYPRRPNDPEMNEQVRRYNRMSAALAAAWGLPYVDFHQAMLPLPGRGLADDGYHPNTYTVGPRSRACDFGEQGLQFGNNNRNLMVLELLDAVRRAYVGSEVVETNEASRGSGTEVDPVRIAALPFAARLGAGELAAGEGAAGCGARDVTGPRHVFRVNAAEPLRVRLTALGMGPIATHVEVRSAGACLGDGTDEQVLELPAGATTVVVTAFRPRRVDADAGADARVLFVLSVEPPATTRSRR